MSNNHDYARRPVALLPFYEASQPLFNKPSPQQLIYYGVHPFKAIRQEYCESLEDVAAAIGYRYQRYQRIEEGEVDYTAADAIRFSDYFNIPLEALSPYAHGKPRKPTDMPVFLAMIELEGYDPFSSVVKEVKQGCCKDMLMEEADESLSIMAMKRQRLLLTNGRLPLTQPYRNYLDFLIKNDGNPELLTREPGEWLNLFLSDLELEKSELRDRLSRTLKVQKMLWKSVNIIGNRLFSGKWASRYNGHMLLMIEMFGIKEFLQRYKDDPVACGLEKWPPESMGSIKFAGREMSWRQAKALQISLWKKCAAQEDIVSSLKREVKMCNDSLLYCSRKAESFDAIAFFWRRQLVLAQPQFKVLNPWWNASERKPIVGMRVPLKRMGPGLGITGATF